MIARTFAWGSLIAGLATTYILGVELGFHNYFACGAGLAVFIILMAWLRNAGRRP